MLDEVKHVMDLQINNLVCDILINRDKVINMEDKKKKKTGS